MYWEQPLFCRLISGIVLSPDAHEQEMVSKVMLYTVNDTNYELDESLTKLAVIRAAERKQADKAQWASMGADEREAMEALVGAIRSGLGE